MSKQVRVKNSIRKKLLLTMIGLIFLLLAILTFIQISTQKRFLEKELDRRIALMKEMLEERGRTISHNLARQTENDVASFNLSNVTEMIHKTVKEDNGLSYVILMDYSRKAYIHTSKPELEQEILSDREDLYAADQKNATFNNYEMDGTAFKEFITQINISTEPWGVLRLGFSLAELNNEISNSKIGILKQTKNIIIRSVITLAVFVAVGVALVFLISIRLSSPIIALTKSARLLAKGDFTVANNINIKSNDEIGILATSFIEMAKDLENHNRILEQKVEERTQQLRDANNELHELDKAKSGFLNTVSHELRTPLTSIVGFAKIIKSRFDKFVLPQIQPEDSKAIKKVMQMKDDINVIISEGDRLTNLINNVLDLAKIEAGKIEWKKDSFSIYDVIEQAVASTSALFEQKDIKLIVDIDADLPVCIGDKDRLVQVVINLISNAVKFTEKGSIRLSARVENREMIVSVVDTGIGMKQADLEKVFDKFKQVGDTLTNKPVGTGLGLSICEQIIKQHGGKIWATSEVGKGSSFSFTLPVSTELYNTKRREKESEATTCNLKSSTTNKYSSSTNNNKNILVVDDEKHIRTLIKKVFESEGFGIVEAKNGFEAIAMAKKFRPDIIILDILMPDINGLDVVAVLKNDKNTNTIPIIINSIEDMKPEHSEIDIAGYFTKPVDMDELIRTTKDIFLRRYNH
ncbi:MAG: response regulator [Candidatus Scalindua rubra]|uniref:histidine kinase n=1 Tax=Candidatus Scalindua brodae TaxID=237368 RepID=A0A0B0EQA0_9BACT|nr:MAG: hypothetical protein SCABRO_00184 [Candidatus Scalindua brodae]MBZ0110538.1 response regulator [Candidatus Scalindua rubra]TWU30778.1 Sensor protein TorS [Candidatus Brocadiaceae bacterium S225]